jgi:hypothetical protein
MWSKLTKQLQTDHRVMINFEHLIIISLLLKNLYCIMVATNLLAALFSCRIMTLQALNVRRLVNSVESVIYLRLCR